MIPGLGIAEKPTRKVLAEYARLINLPAENPEHLTVEQKIEIGRILVDLNAQLERHKKAARAQKAKKQGKAAKISSPFA